MSGSAVKSHDYPKWEKYYLQERQFCTSCRSRVVCQFRKQFVFNYAITRIVGTRGISSIWKQSGSKLIFRFSIRAKWRNWPSELGQESWGNHKMDKNHPLADMSFRLEDPTDNPLPTGVPAPAHISQDSDSELSTKVATKSRKQSIFTRFPKDRNWDVCLKTKITKASYWRCTGGALPRAEKFGDLITADHKVFDEGCESRDNHRNAVVVQGFATRWIQSYPCKTKISHETGTSLSKFLEPSQAPKVVCTDNSMEFKRAC